MRKLLLSTGLALLLVGGAYAQNITKSLQGAQDPRGPVGLDSSGNSYFPNHINNFDTSPGPTFQACGASPVMGTGATDNAGTFTAGSTSCAVLFATAFNIKPACILQEQTGTTVPTYSSFTTGFYASTIVASQYAYLCFGY
jgi:hypothetical protein